MSSSQKDLVLLCLSQTICSIYSIIELNAELHICISCGLETRMRGKWPKAEQVNSKVYEVCISEGMQRLASHCHECSSSDGAFPDFSAVSRPVLLGLKDKVHHLMLPFAFLCMLLATEEGQASAGPSGSCRLGWTLNTFGAVWTFRNLLVNFLIIL